MKSEYHFKTICFVRDLKINSTTLLLLTVGIIQSCVPNEIVFYSPSSVNYECHFYNMVALRYHEVLYVQEVLAILYSKLLYKMGQDQR